MIIDTVIAGAIGGIAGLLIYYVVGSVLALLSGPCSYRAPARGTPADIVQRLRARREAKKAAARAS